MILNESFTLSNGVKIPKIGFGTWQIKEGEDAYRSVRYALEVGYRHIDTAAAYGNEGSVGRAIKDSGIPREEIFVTTKLHSHIKGYESTFKEFDKSLKKLGLDYLDLYLIHAPWPWSDIGSIHTEGNIQAWKAMVEIYQSGKVRSIGVSNFEPFHIEPIVKATNFIPHVNQIPFFVGRPQHEVRAYCEKHNILVEAYSPLITGRIFKMDVVNEMAKKYGVTTAQLAIRYTLEQNTLPLPKSTHEQWILENTKVDFSISKEDIAILEKIEGGYK
ncbi:MAG TPA: aldo/keto reductase [Bacilli bacterium]|nr:aldo/keto reductase [Bacilli bacterium]